MKKQLSLIFISVFFFFQIGQSQGLEWSFNLKSNYSIVDQSVNNFDASTFSNNSSNKTSDIFQKSNIGLGIGIQTQIKIYKDFSFISGIEGTFMNFNEGVLEATSNNATSIVEHSLFDENASGISSNNLAVIDPTIPILDEEWNQNLIYIKIPLNIGYTIPSEKLKIYGGVWYARLIQSGSNPPVLGLRNTRNTPFDLNEYGANAGLEVSLSKRVNAIMDVTNNLRNDSSNSVFTSSVDVVNDVPLSRNAKLISLGLNFKLK